MAWTPPRGGALLLDFAEPIPAGGPLRFEFEPQEGVTLHAVTDDAAGAFAITARRAETGATFAATTDDAAGHVAVWAYSTDTTALTWAASTDDARAAVAVAFDSNVSRPDAFQRLSRWREAGAAVRSEAAGWHFGRTLRPEAGSRWGEAPAVAAPAGARWHEGRALTAAPAVRWREAPRLASAASGGWEYPPVLSRSHAARWAEAPCSRSTIAGQWEYPPAVRPAGRTLWREAVALALSVQSRTRDAAFLGLAGRARWYRGRRAAWAPRWPSAPIYPADPGAPTVRRVLRLDFAAALPTGGLIRLDFGSRIGAPHLIFWGDTLIVDNSISITRVSDGAEIEAVSTTLSRDITQVDWELSLDVADLVSLDRLQGVNADPVELLVSINGYQWDLLAMSSAGSRKFAAVRAQVHGQSRAALLAAPYRRERSYSNAALKVAAQLLDDELTDTGWTMAYHASLAALLTEEWTVPAGVFSYQGKATLDALALVAGAIDAQLYADRTAQVFHLAPRYAVPPWQWADATPDVTIPADLVSVSGERPQPKTAWDQVIVSGQAQGVRVTVRRAGTAGNVGAPEVVDPLICQAGAGLARGRSVLSRGGRQSRVSLEELPITTGIGLIEPGALVEVQEFGETWRGLCVANSVSARFGRVTQSVELERHFA